jgi:succinate-semialdehyde dehydrogenase/glutarate-semialdehyde dehydrogenase
MFFQTVNPATGELVQTFEAISGDDLEVALATAHKAYETDWRLRPVAVSRAALRSQHLQTLNSQTPKDFP